MRGLYSNTQANLVCGVMKEGVTRRHHIFSWKKKARHTVNGENHHERFGGFNVYVNGQTPTQSALLIEASWPSGSSND